MMLNRSVKIVPLAALVAMLLAQPAVADTILCFGDSNTHGGYGGGTGYPVFLPPLVGGYSVVSSGRGGETTGQGLGRIAGEIARHKPSYVLIMEGTNDVSGGISRMTVAHNLSHMASIARSHGAIPVLSTLPPYTKYSAGAQVPAYNASIASALSSAGVTLVDSYGNLIGNWPNLNTDGIHTNAAGARIVASTFASAVSGKSDGGGGCFIATAAFGSYMEPHVMVLRQFRDRRLLPNRAGQWLVQQYYRHSPPLADWIAAHDWARATVRLLLLPLVGLAWLVVHAPLALLGASGAILLGILLLLRRRRAACLA